MERESCRLEAEGSVVARIAGRRWHRAQAFGRPDHLCRRDCCDGSREGKTDQTMLVSLSRETAQDWKRVSSRTSENEWLPSAAIKKLADVHQL